MAPAFVVMVDALAGGLLGAAAIASSWLLCRRRASAGRGDIVAMQASLDRALGRIRQFAGSQVRFVGALAEEISRPLNTALVHAELLLASSREPATVERYAQGLVEDVRHLAGMVDGFLRLAHQTGQEDTSQHVPVHMHDVVLAAIGRCRALSSARGVTITPVLAETPDGSPVEVLGDAVLLEAMLENLVRNGVLASPRGAKVEVVVHAGGDAVTLDVRDSGAPLMVDDFEDVMHGFFQLPGPVRDPSGSSLSLAIAMRVAEHHRGTLSLSNPASGGCRFEVHLPRWSGTATPPLDA
jgi:signal transduction histidine kinase